MTVLSLKAMLLKKTSSENPQKDKMSIRLSSFWKGQATKENQKLRGSQKKLHSGLNFPCFNYTEAKSVLLINQAFVCHYPPFTHLKTHSLSYF